MAYNFFKTIYNDLLYMVKNLTIKREDLARANMTTESNAAWEMYLAAVKGDTNFYNYPTLPAEAIMNSNIPSHLKPLCIENKNYIPEEMRDEIVRLSLPIIIDHYQELNEYYRILNGKPVAGDSIFYVREYADIPHDIPLHQLGSEYIALLEQRHAIDVLRERYPDRYYLNYLGEKQIDLITAHEAKPFEILYCPYCENERTRESFMTNYHIARRYVMTCCYNKAMFTERPMYDPFIGFVIISLAIRNTLVPEEADYLTYEEIINACLESYGMLDFFKNLPFSYKKRLVLAMDHLLQYKGTDPVLVDVMKIFKLDDYTVNRYYLLKTHKLDPVTGEPVFPKLEDGSLDYDNMHDFRFLKKDIASEDIVINDDNLLSYDSVVEDDSLWQVNSEEYTRVMREDFNLMMSKYISVDIAYDLTQLLYEVNFFINLILNSRANVAALTTTNMYATDGYSDAYTMIVFMLAAMAKRTGYDGNIIYTPSQIAEIYGWDINELDDIIREIYADIDAGATEEEVHEKFEHLGDATDQIIQLYELGDLTDLDLLHNKGIIWNFNFSDEARTQVNEVLDEFYWDIKDWNICYEQEGVTDNRMELKLEKPIGAVSADRLTNIYLNNTRILKWIDDKIMTVDNLRQHEALVRLKTILFNSANTRSNFMKQDGTYAKTYLDMLEDIDPKLAQKINKSEGDDLNNLLLYLLEKLERMFDSDDLKYLFINTPGTSLLLLGVYIRRAIELFKASSVQLDAINIILDIGGTDGSPLEDIRIITEPWTVKHLHIWDSASTIDEVSFTKILEINDSVDAEPKISPI